MRRPRQRLVTPAIWSPPLQRLVRVAERECPRGHAEALAALTALALIKVPSRGIFDPSARGEQEIFAAIEAIARSHLGLGEAKAGWKTALDNAGLPFQRRDDIERAALEIRGIGDTAYYYAGLAFGLAFAYGYRN